MAPSYERRKYSGSAVVSAISAGITNSTTEFDVVDASSFPTDSFFCVIDEGLAGEEKIFVTTRTGNTLEAVLRGEDGPAAQIHSAGAAIRHVFVAQDADEMNAFTSALQFKGDLMTHGDSVGPLPLSIGAEGDLLRVSGTEATGLAYVTPYSVVTEFFSLPGDLLVGTGGGQFSSFGMQNNGSVFTVDDDAPLARFSYQKPIAAVTDLQMHNFTGADLWDGRVVYNTSFNQLMTYDMGPANAWKGTRSDWAGAVGNNGTVTADNTEKTTATVTVPDQGCAGTIMLFARVRIAKSLAGEPWLARLKNSTGIIGAHAGDPSLDTPWTNVSFNITTADTMVAGASKTFTLVIVSTLNTASTASFTADSTVHRIDALFVPTGTIPF